MSQAITQSTATSPGKIYFSIEVLRDFEGRKLQPSRPDGDGYYDIVGAELDEKSRNECRYDTKSIVDQIVTPSSVFNIKLTQGQLFGEWGHPPKNATLDRIEDIDEKLVCQHIKKVWCSEPTSDGKQFIYLKVKPFGPYGSTFEQSLLEGCVNTAESLRSIIKQSWDNKYNCQMRQVIRLVTFDAVLTPGFLRSCKRYSNDNSGTENFLVGRELNVQDFFDNSGKQIAFESLKDRDLMNLFGLTELSFNKLKAGLHMPGTGSYVDTKGNMQSLIHSYLCNKRKS